MKKFLYLSALYKSIENTSDFEFYVSKDIAIIDKMWHNFILFTLEYNRFCLDYLGRFIYHRPLSKKMREENLNEFKQDFDKFRDIAIESSKKSYEFVFDNLGRDTLIK